ncbi:hypothetical protein [Frateuria defendens]|uniref:hypothetical protein n=1 Tax=Frateuria defendens TaxID=2219559 RepID=UPI000A836182|nr:hypothetical protein [Frateuria defendens]
MKLVSKLAAALANGLAAFGAHAGNVLVVLSDTDHLDLKDGKVYPTGFYLNELMQPVKLFLDAGHTVTFAPPRAATRRRWTSPRWTRCISAAARPTSRPTGR